MPNTLLGKNISDTYQKLVQVENGVISDGTGSLLPISFNSEGVTITGTLHANTISSSRVTSSIIYTSGSSTFGDEASDTHTFTGNITASKHIFANGDITAAGNLLTKGDLASIESGLIVRTVNSAGIGTTILQPTSTLAVVGDLFTNSHITASGNISSSGNLTADEITAGGDINIGAHLNMGSVGGTFSQIKTPNITSNGANQGIAFRSTTGYQFVSSIVQAAGPSSGFFDVGGNTLFNGNTHTFVGHITASGNISASLASHIQTPELRGVGVGTTQLNVQGQITASGNISASGDIISSKFILNNDTINGVSLVNATNGQFDIKAGNGGTLESVGFKSAKTSFASTVHTNITASGIITASKVFDEIYHTWEATARPDTNDDTNWQGPSAHGVISRDNWNQDYATLYSTITGSVGSTDIVGYNTGSRTIEISRLFMNTGWRVPNQANYSCSIKSIDFYVAHNTNDAAIEDDIGFSCSMWYSDFSDLKGNINNVGDGAQGSISEGQFVQRHAVSVDSSQFKASDDALFKYHNYYVSASNLGLNLAPGSMMYPRIKTFGTTQFVTNIHWIVNYTKIPL